MDELFELTPEQQRCFNRLKKAYQDCEKSGIYFINDYGTLFAVDEKKINLYDDNPENGILDNGQCINNSFHIANEWADDLHYFHKN